MSRFPPAGEDSHAIHGAALGYVEVKALEQLAAANAHVAQLQQQIANQPAPAPTPTPPDPKAVEALNAMMELAKALKLVQM